MHPGGPPDNYLFAKWVSMSVVGLPNPDLLKMRVDRTATEGGGTTGTSYRLDILCRKVDTERAGRDSDRSTGPQCLPMPVGSHGGGESLAPGDTGLGWV